MSILIILVFKLSDMLSYALKKSFFLPKDHIVVDAVARVRLLTLRRISAPGVTQCSTRRTSTWTYIGLEATADHMVTILRLLNLRRISAPGVTQRSTRRTSTWAYR